MPYVILTALLIALAWLPRWWVTSQMMRHAREREDLPGTGGELALHLVKRFDLEGVTVEETDDRNDHYDPANAVIRLGTSNFNGRSLTAVAIAAHEVGHAIQFSRNEAVSRLRKQWIPTAMLLKKLGVVMMTAAPVVGLIVRAPSAIFAFVAISLGLQLLGALAYLIVLPEEWDASFRKALPILMEGEYVEAEDLPAVQGVLKAAAWTYFASALADLVNIGRWIMILRR